MCTRTRARMRNLEKKADCLLEKEQRTAGPEGEGVSVSKQTLGNYAGGEGTVGQLSLNQQCPGFF